MNRYVICREPQRGPESGFDRLMRNLTNGHYSPLDKSHRRSVELTLEAQHEEAHEFTAEPDDTPMVEKRKARTGAEFVLEYDIAKPSPPQSPLTKGPYVPPGERVLSKAGKPHDDDDDGKHDEVNTAMLQRMRVSIWDSVKPVTLPRDGLHTGQVGVHLDSMTADELHAFFGMVSCVYWSCHAVILVSLRMRCFTVLDFGRLFYDRTIMSRWHYLSLAEYDVASLYMVSIYCFVTKGCAKRPGAAASVEHRRRERHALLARVAGELAGATRLRQARPSSMHNCL